MTTAVCAAKCRVATGISAPQSGHEGDEPGGPGQQRGEPREEDRAEHGSGRPAQHARGERPEVGLDEEDGGRGQPVPVGVVRARAGQTAALAPKQRATRSPYSRPPAPTAVRRAGTGVRRRVCSGVVRRRARSSRVRSVAGGDRSWPVGRRRPRRRAAVRRRGRAGPARSGRARAAGRAAAPVRTASASRRGPSDARAGTGPPRPGERGRRLGERQRGGVLRVQPPFGAGAGVPPQPGPGERVLRVVERGGQGDATCGAPGVPPAASSSPATASYTAATASRSPSNR